MELDVAIQRFMREEHISDTRQISSVDDIRYAATKAYHDLMLRTITGHTPIVQENCVSWLAVQIKKFIENQFASEDDYTIKHKTLCNDFLAELNRELEKSGAKQQSFGKAQKAVNMAMKYLYCFRDRDSYKNLFAFAHMPLDSYTLNWYYHNSTEHGKEKQAWSKLSADEYYDTIVKEISDILEKQPNYEGTTLPSSPLEADFIIWAGEKHKAAVKELKSVLRKSSKNLDFIKCITDKDKKEMRDCFDIIMQSKET